jgi:hypothetical protein
MQQVFYCRVFVAVFIQQLPFVFYKTFAGFKALLCAKCWYKK